MPQNIREKNNLSVLYAGFFLVDFDLVVINPLLLPVADSLHASLGSVTLALTVYLLLFGIMQPVHGIISDMVGRVRVMRVALAGMGVANLIAAVAPNVALLILGRAAAGAFASAMVPVTMAYVGDRVPLDRRQQTMATLLSTGALGAAAATVVAGALTDLVTWRSPIVLVALTALVLAVIYRSLPEAATPPPVSRPSLSSRFSDVFRGGWFRFLMAFAFVEGAAMLGFFNFFGAALQVHGNSILISGIVTGAYGLAAVVGGMIVRAVSSRTSAPVMFGAGTVLLFAGYLIAAYTQTIASILIASILSGLALSVAQSTIQTWVVELAAPTALGTVVSLVACSVFTGAAVGTAAVGGLASAHNFGLLFGIAAMVTLPVIIVGVLSRARFAHSIEPV